MRKREEAQKLDQEARVKSRREDFHLIPDVLYMDGNSLGLFPKRAEENLIRILNEYKGMGIDVWSKTSPPLFTYQDTLAEAMAPIMGAKAHEVTIHSNTTVNIHSMLATFYQPEGRRTKILVDDLNFPTGRYAIESHLRMRGYEPAEHLVEIKSKDGLLIEEEAIIAAMTEEIALAFLPGVLYRSGQLLDMAYLTEIAHEQGIIIGFDCSHSAGSVPHKLHDWRVDFALWCTYKYLNGGPGSTAGLFIHEDNLHRPVGLQGWQGYRTDKQFDLLNEFEAAKDAGGWQTGTQHIFSMAPLAGSLKIFHEVGMDNLRERSLQLTDYFIDLATEILVPLGFEVATPIDHKRRGGHVALLHEEALRVNAALKDNGILPDFRGPNVIRFAPVALYNTFEEIFEVVMTLKDVIEQKLYLNYKNERGTVA